MIPRYYIKENYPFAKYEKGTFVFPTDVEEIEEFKKFPRIFVNETILFEVIEFDNFKNPSVVKCLVSSNTYKIGDEVIYTLSHINYHCSFKITGFKISTEIGKSYIYACYDADLKRACGLSLCNHLINKDDYKMIKYLEDEK
jgi:hypothetical protein